MTWIWWAAIVYLTLSSCVYVSLIGKPRKPITPIDAVITGLINSVLIVAILATH